MKKNIFVLLIAFATISISSCTKYEEGGYASKTRITGTWTISELLINGEPLDMNSLSQGDRSISFKNIVFEKDGNGTFNYSINNLLNNSDKFEWEFSDDKTLLEIEGSSSSSSSSMIQFLPKESEILKLTKTELKLKGTILENSSVIITLEKK